MFSFLQNLLSSAKPDVQNIVQAILWVLGVGFALKPGQKAMHHFGDQDWGKGVGFVFAVVAIFILPVIVTVALQTAGSRTGDDINNRANLVALVPAISMYIGYKYFYKKDSSALK